MTTKHRDSSPNVINAANWLESRVEELVLAKRYDDAIASLRWLATSTTDEEEARISALSLGYLYLLEEDYHRARQWLAQAEELGSDRGKGDLLYGLGHAFCGLGDPAGGAVYFLEAFVESSTTRDSAECLRSAALACLESVGPGEPCAAMLLGALDRDLGNPWILEALMKLYSAEERWLETLDVLRDLQESVRKVGQSVVPYRAPSRTQLLRDRLLGSFAQEEELQEQAQEINRRLRSRFEVVLDARRYQGPTALAPASTAGVFGRFLRSLETKERSLELLEGARKLWALSSHEGFEELLGPVRLAAAVEVLLERLYWRVQTPAEEIARRHGASPDAVGPAARLIAGRLNLYLFENYPLMDRVSLQEKKRLRQVSQALLFGESLEAARHGAARLA